MSRVSIIIPCHDDGKYLSQSLESARAQTYGDVEIIIVDDHSEDNFTISLLESLKKEGQIVLHLPEGKKYPSCARNYGIAHASGDYILPLDADDLLSPGYAAKAVAILDEHQDMDICYCDAAYFGLKHGRWKLPEYSWKSLLLHNMIFVSAVFRKKRWEEVGGYDENVDMGNEDHLFWLKMASPRGNVSHIPETLFSYRVRPHSRTAVLRGGGYSEKVLAMNRFMLMRNLYEANLDNIYESCIDLALEKSAREKLFSWRICKPFLAMEGWLREVGKKFVGR